MEDFISNYIEYAAENCESPRIFHRWSIMTGLGAYLSRDFYLQHGHFKVLPNMYTMLIGVAGTRKSTAIKISKSLLKDTGYEHFSAAKTTKEKFLLDLAGLELDGAAKKNESLEDIMTDALWGDKEGDDKQMYIAADEFNNFIGNGNLEFISLLGELWDFEGTYTNRIKNGTSVNINNPTINILGGNTPTNFATAFPPEIFGQGFFSRLLLIHSESSGRRIAFPEEPDAQAKSELIGQLKRIKQQCFGPASLSRIARHLLEKIYHQPPGFDDIRFESYLNRRFNHLLKLCLISAASRSSRTIEESDVVYANTVLAVAERGMPKALGEFGKAKNADVVHKVLSFIYSTFDATGGPSTAKMIFKSLSGDIGDITTLSDILKNLHVAEKIQIVSDPQSGSSAYLPKRKAMEYAKDGSIDLGLLTAEEKDRS